MGTVFHSRAPSRIDLGGGGSDAPPFSKEFGGTVVNGAIRKYVHTTLEITPDSRAIRICSPGMRQDVEIPEISAIREDGQLDLPKIIIRELGPDFGFRLAIESALPPGCGLSTSAAVGTATAMVVSLAMGEPLTQPQAFRLAVRVEREILGWPGGSQDQYAAAIGGLNSIEFDGLAAKGRHLWLSPESVWQLEKDLFLCYTGEAHLSGSIHTDIKASYNNPESKTRQAMHELKRIGYAVRDALEEGDFELFGKLLYANWDAHKNLHESCTNPKLERFYDIIRAHGAPGAKTCGAGGGGCIVIYFPGTDRQRLKDALRMDGGEILDVLFDAEGTVGWNQGT